MPDRNYLLGYGERLTVPIEIRPGGAPKKAPYTFRQARERLAPMLASTAGALETLPTKACPRGEAVAALTLHPEYFAKSHYPGKLLNRAELRAVGSRPRRITPDRRSRGREPEEAVTTQLFVAGRRSSFREIAQEASEWKPDSTVSQELPAIERVSPFTAAERIRPLPDGDEPLAVEVVLHASEDPRDRFIVAGFKAYLEELDLDPTFRRIFFAGGLCFLPLFASAAEAREIARFSFLRVLRPMPRLRPISPMMRGIRSSPRSVKLPQQKALDPNLRVAILDGGLRSTSPLTRWADSLDTPGVGPSHVEQIQHGESVTSALLFGTVTGPEAERPLCHVDHHRVLDANSGHDPLELTDVLDRVKSVLDQRNYEFFNLSIGPEVPVDDDDVHVWTAVLDEHLSDGRSLATLAAGNTGEEPDDPVLSKWRVQVPSDCVNGVTVGATDRLDGHWRRASYSSRGPGRSPGIVKPDLMAFGGSQREPFWVLDPNGSAHVAPTEGTSYSAPAAMRAGVAVRAYFGSVLSPLAIRALLIHNADPAEHPQNDVGWGRIPTHLDDLVVCPEGCVRIVYQDTITPASYRRIRIPVPRTGLSKRVSITATFCFAVSVDSAHPGNYTKGGLSISFRPHKARFARGAVHPRPASFFQLKKLYGPDRQIRSDAHKWETCLHGRVGKRVGSLDDPVFDIHYNARAGGHSNPNARAIRYALVITVEAKGVRDLYDRVLRGHRTKLQPLVPIIQIPARPRTSLFA